MNRRSFIKRSLFTLAAAGAAPSLFGRTALAAGGNGKILVVYHLFGGNDVLNTLITTDADKRRLYESYRPDIFIPAADTIDLKATGMSLGMHPSLKPLVDDLWNNGQLALVSQVGYPNHNRSHFLSTAIWNTGDPNRPSKSGWLGRFIDEQNDPYCATNLGNTLPRALRGVHATGLSIGSVARYGFGHGAWEKKLPEEVRRQIARQRSGTAEEVRRAMDHMLRSVKEVRGAMAKQYAPSTTFPLNRYGAQFADIARLIKYDFPSQVYYAAGGGYDTHGKQGGKTGRHADLLSQLAGALAAFRKEMIAQGKWNDVLVMIFSEFGRRVKQNASAGTDHGKGGLLFFAGGAVKGGIYGEEPELDESSFDHGDLPVKIDFRNAYAAAAGFIGANPADLVGSGFNPLPVI